MVTTSGADRLMAGVAVADVTPHAPVTMSGFGARTERSRGVHDQLFARAVAVSSQGAQPTLLVSVDCLGIDADLADRVRSGLSPLDAGRIAVVATHTHGGPATLAGAHLGTPAAADLDLIVAGCVAAGRRALATMADVSVRFGVTRVSGVGRNRRDSAGPVDDEVSVVSFWRPGSTLPLAALVSFALHPVVLGADNLLLTRDYVGFLVDAVEARYPGCVALFANGCAGQINQGHPASASWTTAASNARTFEAAALVGEALGSAACRAIDHGSEPVTPGVGVRAAVAEARLPLAEPDPPAAESLERYTAELAEARSAGDAAREGLLAGLVAWSARSVSGRRSLERVVALQAMAWGDLTILFIPGEPFVEYGLALKRRHGPRLMTVGYANDAPGYLPTAAALTEGGYETDLAYRYYGVAGPYTAEVEERLLSACDEVVAALRVGTLR